MNFLSGIPVCPRFYFFSSTLYRKFEAYIPIPNFYIRVSGNDLYISMIRLFWNLYLPVLHERTLGSTAGAERRAGNCLQAVVGGSSLPVFPSSHVVELRVHLKVLSSEIDPAEIRLIR